MSYHAYRHISEPWSIQIPEHWDNQKIKRLFEESNERNNDHDAMLLSFSYKKGLIPFDEKENRTHQSNDLSKYRIVRPGQLLENRMQAWRGMFICVDKYGCVSPDYSVFNAKKQLCVKYYEYLFRTPAHVSKFANASKGVGDGFNRLYTPQFGEISTIYPPYEEQNQIVRYLDWKISRINKLISIKKHQIKLLQENQQSAINETIAGKIPQINSFQETDIDWMKEMPIHWVISSVKNHFRIEKRIAGKEGFDVLSITQKGLKVKDITTNEGQMAQSYADYQFVNPGDYAMNHMDLLTGYIDISKHFGVTSPDYRVFTLNNTENCCPEYYLRIFQMCYKRRIFYRLGRGAATKGRWRLPRENFLNFTIPLPPKNEQIEMAKICDEIETNTSSVILILNRQIDLFTEYLTRLISDVVTGIIDVRGIEIPEYEAVVETADDIISDDDEEYKDENEETEE